MRDQFKSNTQSLNIYKKKFNFHHLEQYKTHEKAYKNVGFYIRIFKTEG